MKREYLNIKDTDTVRFFTGTEIEKTPAFGKETLFVAGLYPIDFIDRRLTPSTKHIYFGANMSYKGEPDYKQLIMHYLEEGFWVTLDFDISYINSVIEMGLGFQSKFIPVVSAKIPFIAQLGYNACLKIDDTTFEHSNPGVWVHQLYNLQTRETFTTWDEYKNDIPA